MNRSRKKGRARPVAARIGPCPKHRRLRRKRSPFWRTLTDPMGPASPMSLLLFVMDSGRGRGSTWWSLRVVFARLLLLVLVAAGAIGARGEMSGEYSKLGADGGTSPQCPVAESVRSYSCTRKSTHTRESTYNCNRAARLTIFLFRAPCYAADGAYGAPLRQPVSSIEPCTVPLQGGVAVTVRGTGFVDAALLVCRFGALQVPAYFASSSAVTCVSPQGYAGFASVQVAVGAGHDGDLDVTQGRDSTVLFRVPSLVTSLLPRVSVTDTPTSVHILGANLIAGATCGLRSRSGVAEAPGHFASSALTRCEVNPLSLGHYVLGVGTKGGDGALILDSERSFVVSTGGDRILNAVPLTGSPTGGAMVSISAGAVSDTLEVACAFGTTTHVRAWSTYNSWNCATPARVSGTAEIALKPHHSMIRLAWSSFTYAQEIELYGAVPDAASAAGDTLVTVLGSKVLSGDVNCLINGIEAPVRDAPLYGAFSCLLPRTAPGFVELRILQHGARALSTILHMVTKAVLFVSQPQLTAADTNVVRISGEHFHENMRCILGSQSWPSRYISSAVATCLPFHDDLMSTGFLEVFDVTIVHMPTVKAKQKLSADEAGGSKFSLKGYGFISAHDSRVKCGSIFLKTKAHDFNTLEIISPATSPKNTLLTFCIDWILCTNSARLVIQQNIKIESIENEDGPASGGASLVVRGSGVGASRAVSLGASRASARPAEGGSALAALSAASATGAGFVCVGVVSASGLLVFGSDVFFLYTQDPIWFLRGSLLPSEGSVVSVVGSHFDPFWSVKASDEDFISVDHLFVSSVILKGEVSFPGGEVRVGIAAIMQDIAARCIPLATVSDIMPKFIPEGGGSVVSISGSNAGSVDEAVCAFGSTSVSTAVFHVGGALECISPGLQYGVVPVRSSANSFDFSVSAHTITVKAPIVVVGVYPEASYVEGGLKILIVLSEHGSSNISQGLNDVKFGDRYGALAPLSSAAGVNSGIVAAAHDAFVRVVPMAIQAGFVHVTTIAGDLSQSDAHFLYRDAPVVTNIQPAFASTVGGVRAMLTGANMHVNDEDWTCIFDGAYTDGMLVSTAVVLCEVPKGNIGGVRVALAETGIGEVPNRSSDVGFFYIANAIITTAAPLTGPERGGTVVSIVGSTFSDGERHSCKFGTTSQVAAFRQAASIIECLSPAHDVSNVHLGAANARVFEFSTTLTNFKYRMDAALFGVVPESVHDDAGARQVMIWGLGLSFPLEVAIGHLTGSVLTVSLHNFGFSEEATVRVPIALHGFTPIHVTTQDRLVSDDNGAAVQVLVAPAPRLVDAQPSLTGARTGGIVTLRGSDIVGRVSHRCYVGARAGIMIGRSSVIGTCSVPAAPEEGARDVEVSVGTVEGPQGGSTALTYIAEPAIWFVRPSQGISSGGTAIFVAGSDFDLDAHCKFGALIVVSASVPVTSRAQCISPASVPSSSASVAISSNRVDFVALVEARFVYMGDPIVSTLDNVIGASGGALLRIHGSNLVPSVHLRVRVGLMEVTVAAAEDDTVLTLVMPHRVAYGFVPVEVTTDQSNYTSSGVQYLYTDAPIVNNFQPSRGPLAGATCFQVQGRNFALSGAVKCELGGIDTTGRSLSTTVMTCIDVPTAPEVMQVDVVVSTGGDHMRSASGTQWQYVGDVVVSSVNPPVGPEDGGQAVSVAGQAFGHQSYGLTCSFGPRYVPGSLAGVGSQGALATCIAPAMAPGEVAVRLSNNGKDFSVDNPTFAT